jgi:hypothetical protein
MSIARYVFLVFIAPTINHLLFVHKYCPRPDVGYKFHYVTDAALAWGNRADGTPMTDLEDIVGRHPG